MFLQHFIAFFNNKKQDYFFLPFTNVHITIPAITITASPTTINVIDAFIPVEGTFTI